jgi:membrane fusion protein (multidrug efflux system)
MRVGQQVEVHVDSYPGKKFDGTVVSVSPGTGSQFSLLPAENATGNWVKVVQRLPVRIELRDIDLEFPLHGGLSATVNVDTRHERHLFGSDDPPHATSPNSSSSANSPAAASGELAAAK